MNQILRIVFLTVVTVCFTSVASGQVTFDFGDTGGMAALDLDGLSSGTTTSGGITLTATASSGMFNSTTTAGFGINAAPTGDSTTQFDDGSTDGAETATLSFDMDVSLVSINLTSFGATDEAFATVGGTTITIDTSSFLFPSDVLLAGTPITFGFQAGNGFELDSLVVASVPEPGSLLFLGLASLGMISRRRR